MARMYSTHFSLSPSIYPHLLALVESFEKRETYTPKFEDINRIYKDGIEILVKKETGLSRFLHTLPIATEEEQRAPENRFSLKGPLVRGPRSKAPRVPECVSTKSREERSWRSPSGCV
jgi:hypothetical protein